MKPAYVSSTPLKTMLQKVIAQHQAKMAAKAAAAAAAQPVQQEGPDYLALGMRQHYRWANFEEFAREFRTDDGVWKVGAGRVVSDYDYATGKQLPEKPKVWNEMDKGRVEATIRRVREGDPKLLEKCQNYFRLLVERVQGRIPRPEWRPSLAGPKPNFTGIVNEEPTQALTRVATPDALGKKGGKTHLKIVVNVDAFGGCNAAAFHIRGAAILALAHSLEMAKKNVRIDIAIASSPFGKNGWGQRGSKELNQTYIWTLKPYTSRVAPAILAFAMCSPAVLRTLFFAFWDYCLPENENQRWYRNTCGNVGSIDQSIHDGDVYVGEYGAYHMISSAEDAEKFVLDQLEACGVKVVRDKEVA